MIENNKTEIAWFGKHFGEEPPLVGSREQGAGAIFFAGCNLKCVFCQNYEISQGKKKWKKYSVEELAQIMIGLQKQGAINIDLITPTIWFLQIKEAILIAKERGLIIPVVWNSNGYENASLLKRMENCVDIYLPDFKYSLDEAAKKYSNGPNYSAIAKEAIKEMIRQKGNGLEIENGISKKGIIVRHLVLPNNIENSLRALDILASLSNKIHLSLMSQYSPMYRAKDFPELLKPVAKQDFEKVKKYAFELGFENGWVQESESREVFSPDFSKPNPFG
jgi:putative pyruvate formate lyase activating enzyme